MAKYESDKKKHNETRRGLEMKRESRGVDPMMTDPDIGFAQQEDNGFDLERVEMLYELHMNAKKDLTNDG
jgi:hypothetical protein